MSRAGDVIENPVTGERAMVRVGTEEAGGELLVAELFVKPGGAVAGEHVHPVIEEWFTVLGGRVGFRLDGREAVAEPGERLHVPANGAHDWWNAGDEEAQVIVEVRPGTRFETAIVNLFGLAQDGKTNDRGCPTSCRPRSLPGSSRTFCASPVRRGRCRGRSSAFSRPWPVSWATGEATRSTWSVALRRQ